MIPTVYKIEFPNGQCYIGSTVNFSSRRSTHLRHSRKGKAVNHKLQAAFDAYPVCGIYPIASGFDRETLHLLEQQIIDQYTPELNVAPATPNPATQTGKERPYGPHASIGAFAAFAGVPYSTAKKIVHRLPYADYLDKKNNPPPKREKVVGPPDPRKHARYFFTSGAWYDGQKLRAEMGVRYATYRKRREKGWDKLRASTQPAVVPYYPHPGVNELGISLTTVAARVRHGWTREQASTLPTGTRVKPMRHKYLTVDGVTQTVSEWAMQTGLLPRQLHSRTKLGWTPRQIVGYDPRPVDTMRAKTEAAALERKLSSKKLVRLDGVIASPRKHALARGMKPGQISKMYYLMQRGADAGEAITQILSLPPAQRKPGKGNTHPPPSTPQKNSSQILADQPQSRYVTYRTYS
jgi:hypothetical protein